MIRPLGIFLAVTFTVTVTVSTSKSPAAYLHSAPVGQHERPAYEWIRKQLRDGSLTEPDEVRKYFEGLTQKLNLIEKLSDEYETIHVIAPARGRQLLQMVRQLTEENIKHYEGNNLILFDVLHELILLADVQSTCNDDTVDYFIKINNYVYGGLDLLSGQLANKQPPLYDTGLFNYLQHFGRRKFATCSSVLSDSNGELIKRFENSHTEHFFDQLVASQGREMIKRRSEDEQLIELAGQMDLVSGDLDGKRLLQAAKAGYLTDTELAKSKSGALFRLISGKCSALLTSTSKLLNLFNIVRLFVDSSRATSSAFELANNGGTAPARLVKLNEYAYLCKQLQEATCDQVQGNIRRALSNKLIQKAKELVIQRQH